MASLLTTYFAHNQLLLEGWGRVLSGHELWCRRLPAAHLPQPSALTASLLKMQQPFPPLVRPERMRGLPAGSTPGAESSSKDQWVLAPLD